jgi:hypothetical protein
MDNWILVEGNSGEKDMWVVHYPCTNSGDIHRNYGAADVGDLHCDDCEDPVPENFLFASKMAQ